MPDPASVLGALDPVIALGALPAVSLLAEQLGPVTRITVDALSKASLYITIAVGLSLIFGLMGVLNFAHGSFTMMGAYLGGVVMVVLVTAGTGPWTRVLLFFLAMAFVFGLMTAFGSAVEKTLIRPIYDRPPLFQILLTFGLVLVLDEAARIVVELRGMQPRSEWETARGTAPDVLAHGHHDIAWLNMPPLYLFEVFVGAVVVAATWLFLNRTRYGLYIRAGSEDGEMAQALGIDIRQAFTVVFGVGAGLAAAAGVMLMWDPRFGASVPLTVDALLIAFVVVIIGGLGTFKGTVVAGVLVGFIDAVMTWVFQVGIIEFVGLPEMVMFLALVLVLIVKPQGLFGVEEVGGH